MYVIFSGWSVRRFSWQHAHREVLLTLAVKRLEVLSWVHGWRLYWGLGWLPLSILTTWGMALLNILCLLSWLFKDQRQKPKGSSRKGQHSHACNISLSNKSCFFSENSRRLWLSEIPCWKSFPANFGAAGNFFTDFPAAPNAILANQGLGIFQQGKWLLENRPRLRERSC